MAEWNAVRPGACWLLGTRFWMLNTNSLTAELIEFIGLIELIELVRDAAAPVHSSQLIADSVREKDERKTITNNDDLFLSSVLCHLSSVLCHLTYVF